MAFTTPIYKLSEQDQDFAIGESAGSTEIESELTRGTPIGIFGSTLHLGKLDLIRGAMLVDIRSTKIDGRVIEGMVLRHPSIPYDSSKKTHCSRCPKKT